MKKQSLPLIPRSTWCVAVIVSIMALSVDSVAAQTYYRLQNQWTRDYIHTENGIPEHGKIKQGWWSAMWENEPVAGTEYQRLKNRYTNKYLHVENGPLEQGDVEPGWWSAMWTIEPVPNTTYHRLKNRHTNKYLHVENGPLELGDIEPGWSSALWTMATAGPCDVEAVEAGPIWSNNDAEERCPSVCEKAYGTLNNQWRTTIQGKMSVCDCSVC